MSTTTPLLPDRPRLLPGAAGAPFPRVGTLGFAITRAYAAGRRVLAFENTNAVARHAASQTVVFGQDIDPDKAIEGLDAVTYDQVVDVARGISTELSIACVGPHSLDEFS